MAEIEPDYFEVWSRLVIYSVTVNSFEQLLTDEQFDDDDEGFAGEYVISNFHCASRYLRPMTYPRFHLTVHQAPLHL